MASTSTGDTEKREWVIAYFIALTAVTFVFGLIRAASRLRHGVAGFGFDDLFIALSWIISASMTALTIVGNVHYDFGRHISDIAPDLVTSAVEFDWILNILYQAQTAFAKISIVLFYRRLAKSSYTPRFRKTVWALIAVVILFSIAIIILYVTECLPVNAIWLIFNPTWAATHQHSCSARSQDIAASWISGLVATATDFITALLPTWLFICIPLSSRARKALSLVFALGFLTVVPSLARLVFLVQAAQPRADRTWTSMAALVAGKTEGDVGIICACAPCLCVFFPGFFQSGERGRPASSRTVSVTGSREPSRTRPSVRSNQRAPSERSARSVRFNRDPLVLGHVVTPPPDMPQVLKWSEKSIEDIPEAYADEVVRKQPPIEEDVESAILKDYGGKSPVPRPGTVESWLHLDTDSSDEERGETSSRNPGKFPKSYPNR